LAIIQRARQLGFTLTEIRQLFLGFRDITRASERWRKLSQSKLAELDDLMAGIKEVRGVLRKLMTKCRCDTLDQCGKSIFKNMNKTVGARLSGGLLRDRDPYALSAARASARSRARRLN
jgi:DNA-binding transcriptional MerR regulator